MACAKDAAITFADGSVIVARVVDVDDAGLTYHLAPFGPTRAQWSEIARLRRID